MKTTKWILTCVLAVSMTAATIWAQKDAPENTCKHSEELDMLVDLAELDLLADMLESFLREEENADSDSVADTPISENGFCCIPGVDMDIPGGAFGMGSTGGRGGPGHGRFQWHGRLRFRGRLQRLPDDRWIRWHGRLLRILSLLLK